MGCVVQDLRDILYICEPLVNVELSFVAQFFKILWSLLVSSSSHWSSTSELVNTSLENSKAGIKVVVQYIVLFSKRQQNISIVFGEQKLPNWRSVQEISLESSSLLVPGTLWRTVQKWVKGGGREEVTVVKDMKKKWYVQSPGVQLTSQVLPQSSWNHLAGAEGAHLWTP
jgi:hypothetical protein